MIDTKTNSRRIGFIGLGAMGGPIAGHLVRVGHRVQAHNRTPTRAVAWRERYPEGELAGSVADAADGAEIVFICVGGDADLKEVAIAALSVMQPGTILVDHSTTSAAMARQVAEQAHRKGVHFIDAPVSGGQAGAENGQLAVMAGGDPAVFSQIAPVMAAYAKKTRLIGSVGAGQLTKMVNQICFTGVISGLAEGLFFAENAGLDVPAVLDVISQGAAQSWQMDNRAMTMLQGKYDFGFAVDWVRKDLDIVLTEARVMGVDMPGTTLINEFYTELQGMGHGRSDTSALLEKLRMKAKI